jgi:cytidylate kinase
VIPVSVIAIDGPAASGKSSTAQAVARALGAFHLDSGALYRALTLVDLEAGAPGVDQLLRRAEDRGLGLERVADGIVPVLDGRAAEPRLRSEAVNARVSAVSAVPAVREWVNGRLREAAHRTGALAGSRPLLVLDGRDIGTVVFPDAPVKIFLTATPEARARRRLLQRGVPIDPERLARESAELADRDRQDRARPVAPLRQAPDAIVLDTTDMPFDRQVGEIVEVARKRLSLR